jgi:uncharacterized membrane protein
MARLIKISVVMFVLVNLLMVVLSFADDDDGESPKPAEAIMSFVIGVIITAIWVWYLCKYMNNGKLL